MKRSDAIAIVAAPIFAELVAWRRSKRYVVDDETHREDRREALQQAHALVRDAHRRFSDLNDDPFAHNEGEV